MPNPAIPHLSAPSRASPNLAKPSHAAPDPALPQARLTLPNQTSPRRTRPDPAVPQQTLPYRTAPDQTPPHRTGPSLNRSLICSFSKNGCRLFQRRPRDYREDTERPALLGPVIEQSLSETALAENLMN